MCYALQSPHHTATQHNPQPLAKTLYKQEYGHITEMPVQFIAHNWLNVKVNILSQNYVQKTTLFFGQYPLKNIPINFYLL
jgi:hypothetical protein